MERKSVFEEKAKVKNLDGKRPSTSSSGSNFISSAKGNPNCCHKATEFLCSACLLCIFCPLTIVWRCIKLPCKIGWCAAKHAKNQVCCVSEKKIYAAYSSFSDEDSDFLPGEVQESCKIRMTHKADSCKEKKLQ
ncbi:uncharacterized protein LOC112491692 [Ziziphus jujuba]|uniref:Uncharacterized protein LOC112491692 n=1 Tax=Ziziphus jujuba TaxID=326968 RepID=A0A6P6G6J5_ZIZJJ|nr:uncharacterized protein LOC112491692 [Ziziphus jujuba]